MKEKAIASGYLPDGARYDGVAQGPRGPIPNVTITVCTSTATGLPCSPLATTYTDITLSTSCPAGNQVTLTNSNVCQPTSDGLGNFGFWLAPGTYKYSITGPSITGQLYKLTIPAGTDDSGNMQVGGSITATGNLVIGGSNPWLDVTGPICGAKCDASISAGVVSGTDDTAAFNTCGQTAHNQGGGTVFVPSGKTCRVTQINWGQFINVKMATFVGTSLVGAGNPKPVILFTSASSPLFNLQSTFGIVLDGITFQYTNAAFSGLVIDTSHGGSGCAGSPCDTNGFKILNSSITGTAGTAVNATCLLCWDKTIDSMSFNTTYAYAVNGLRGLAAGGSYSINNQVIGNQFSTGAGASGNISGALILSPGNGWKMVNNDFEFGLASGAAVSSPTGIDATVGGCTACSIDTNFMSDMPAGYTGTVIKGLGSAGGNGTSVTNNYAISGTSALSTFVTIANGATGVVVSGNVIVNYATGFAFAGSSHAIHIFGNTTSNITAWSSGSNPSDGFWLDKNGNFIVFGAVFPTGTVQAPILVGPTTQDNMTFVEGSSGTATVGQDICRGDSTAHALKCSYNNGSFFNMTQTIGSGTSTTNGTGINTLTCQAQPAITITGAAVTDVASCALNAALPATWQTGIVLAPPVVTANTVTYSLCNPTATATITPAATVVRCIVTR